ncbi:unnamed protein product [Caenorhabditis brenneri]
MWRQLAAQFYALDKPWVLVNTIEYFILKEVEELTIYQVEELIKLLKKGCEASYIARYRDDIHGGLSPQRIRKIIEIYFEVLELNRRVESALRNVIPKVVGVGEKQEVRERLKYCQSVDEVSEIAREYGEGDGKSKAQIAREHGLEAPCRDVLNGKFVDMREFTAHEQHFIHLAADIISKDENVKQAAINLCQLKTKCEILITTHLTEIAKQKLEQKRNGTLDRDEWMKGLSAFSDLVHFKRSAYFIRDYMVSTLNRGEELYIIVWQAEIDSKEAKKFHPFAGREVHPKLKIPFRNWFDYSVKNHFIPTLQLGVKKFLLRRAECRAIELFGQNVERLFCQEGIHDKYVIALDPGWFIKAAFLDPEGNVVSKHVFHFSEESTFNHRAADKLKQWSQYTRDMGKCLVFAIGNGSNTRNTQVAVSKLIQSEQFPEEVEVAFCVVPEHGASKYSITDAAAEEFGKNFDPKMRSAVSIGRRLIDPMSEYVKIDPENLGKGQYQHSNDTKLLHEKRVAVVRDRCSLNGTDVNTASKVLLSNISGLNEELAAAIVDYREKHGRFISRNELKRVPKINEHVFQQCAGFLRVTRPDVSLLKKVPKNMEWNPLDETIVHPEDYALATQLLKDACLTVEDTKTLETILLDPGWYSDKELRIFELLLSKPNLRPPPEMMTEVRNMNDLEVDEIFMGTVTNKTDFALFVDIGVEKDGFVHLSHYLSKFEYDNPELTPQEFLQMIEELEIPSVGDQIEVVVERIDNKYDDDSIRIYLKPNQKSN